MAPGESTLHTGRKALGHPEGPRHGMTERGSAREPDNEVAGDGRVGLRARFEHDLGQFGTLAPALEVERREVIRLERWQSVHVASRLGGHLIYRPQPIG